MLVDLLTKLVPIAFHNLVAKVAPADRLVGEGVVSHRQPHAYLLHAVPPTLRVRVPDR